MTKHGVVLGSEEAVVAAARHFSSPPPSTGRESCKKLAAQVDLGAAVTGSWIDSMMALSLMALEAGAADAEHDDRMERRHPLTAAAKGRQTAVFLDYDSTLSPIVEDPDRAVLSDKVKNEVGGKAVSLDVSGLQELVDVGAFYDTGLTAPENTDDDLAMAALRLQFSDPVAFGYSMSPAENAALVTKALFGDDRAAEQGARRYCDVLLPQPHNLMPAIGGKKSRGSCSPTYAVQVSVDAAAGAKAGDPIAGVGVKGAAGAEAGRGHGGLSAVVGVVVASSAATALAAGVAGPVTAFGLFAILVGGLSLAMASVVAGV